MKSVRELLPEAKKGPKQRLAVVFAHDEFVMDAVKVAAEAGIVSPILIGDSPEIHRLIREFGINEPCEIIHEPDPERASRVGVDLINAHRADLLMKGLLDTKILLKAVVNSETGIKAARLLSHVGLVSFPEFDRILFVTDGAMNIAPTVEEKILIIENAVRLAHALGYEEPKVGIVSAVEKVNPKIASTVDAEAINDYYRINPPSGFVIDGPFAVDNLVSPESVRHKGLKSPVAGIADIMLFPNLDGGNIFYKTSVFLGHASAAGLVLGAKVPIILTSRADSAETKSNSIALGVISCHGLSHSRH
ncbi:MAG TPA: bifunctional enoyl-CoA hydratase/phosphate acetyltransferase [Candidatus Izemoplasmatales bacterium]|nr:bifunctional enoyl-CoA hydratase/phosphate acetyltransferase [Bacillota bacterium]HRY77795.1 bifunctional enoyl-CoA hydratase/phosphate acetyltransferase [Candidatus Izemoplasmatales bacterium]